MTEKLPDTPDDDKKKLSLSIPELAIGAVAAVLVALLGSRLGTAGTLAGAAIGSVASALANTFLTAGFERGRDGVKLVVTRRTDVGDGIPDADAGEATSAPDADGATRDAGATELANAVAAEPDAVIGEVPELRAAASPRASTPPVTGQPVATRPATSPPATRSTQPAGAATYRRRQVLGVAAASVLATAGATFAITMGIVTGAEVTTGRSLDGREGATSVGSVVQPAPTGEPEPSTTVAPSASASPTASPTPATATVTPGPAVATPDPSATPVPAAPTPASPPAPSATTTPAAAPAPTVGG